MEGLTNAGEARESTLRHRAGPTFSQSGGEGPFPPRRLPEGLEGMNITLRVRWIQFGQDQFSAENGNVNV